MPDEGRILNNWIETFELYQENSESPEIYKTWVAISCIAAVLKRKCYSQWETEIYPNLYVVLVGPPGKVRKGTAMSPGLRILEQLDITTAADSITREAFIQDLAATNTAEASLDLEPMKQHCSITIWTQELGVFIRRDDHAQTKDLIDLYDCKPVWRYRTKNMGKDHLIGVWVNLIGATTPDALLEILPNTATTTGLTSRIIFVFADRKSKIVALPIMTPAEKELEVQLTRDLEIIHMLDGEFKPTGEYLQRYVNWYEEYGHWLMDRTTDATTSYRERKQTHLRKLSMIFSAARTNSRTVDLCDFESAMAILNKTEKDMHKAYGGMGRNEMAIMFPRVMEVIQEAKEISFAKLLDLFYQDLSREELDNVLLALSMKDPTWCRIESRKNRDGIERKFIIFTPIKEERE